MFPYESSSYEISSKANAFVQNFKEEAVLVATALAGRTLSSTIPTDQVPDSRDKAVDDGPVVNENSTPTEAAVLMSPHLVSGGATTTTTTHSTRIKSSHTGCEPCGCYDYPSKSEAECGRHTVGTGLGGREGCRAGPLPTLSNPNSISLSLSVITSSTCSARQPPPSLHCSALQDPNAMFASEYCGSSNSNSLSAQKKHHNPEIPLHITSQAIHSQPESDKFGALSIQDNNFSIKDNNCNNKNNNNCSSYININDNVKTRVRECKSQNIPGKIITPCNNNNVVRLEKSFKLDCDDYGTRWGIPRGLRLAGGGESSLNTSGTGWGSSSGNNNNTNAGSGSSWGPGGSQNNNAGAQPPAGNPPASQWPGNSRGQANTTSQGQPPSSQQNTGNPGMKAASVSVAVSGSQQPPNSNSNNANQQNVQQNNQQQQSQQQNQQQQNQAQGQQTSGANNNNQQGQQNGSTSWAAAAGKGLPPSGNSGAPSSTTTTTTSSNSSTNNTTTKQQLEQLNTMREALFSIDGWGGQHVNQDSSWDIPPSPEPSGKDNNGGAALPVWKPTINNGTELWEANLRNGGQPPPAVAQKTPWGHTPTTNIGGTWGEDDVEGADTSNVWTGVPPSGAAPPTQWGGANNPGPTTPMWGAPKKDAEGWGGSNWGDPRGAGGGGMDPRDMRPGGGGMVDPREHMRTVIDQRAMGGGDVMIRGDPRGGISGRLNSGATDPMWSGPPQQPPHHVHHQAQPPNKMGPAPNAPVNQWPGPPPKDLGVGIPGVGVNVCGKPTGWEEPSPPAQRRNIPNYDDGTSLWGAQQQRNAMSGQAKVSHWKEMPTPTGIGRGNMQCPPGIPQARMPNSMPGNIKSEGPLWGHPARNGTWEGGPHDVGGGAPWGGEDKVTTGGMTPWSEPPLTPTPWGGPKPKNPMNTGGWVVDGEVDPSSWGHPPKQAPKPLSKEIVWASKQFRILADMGFKKDEVENALRIYNMSLEDALEYLNAMRGISSGGGGEWRRHPDMDPPFVDHSGNNPSFSGRFPGQQIPFPPPGGGPTSAPNLLNNPGNPNLSSISPAIVQKILQQPPPQQAPSQQPTPFNQNSRTPQNQPSAQQLRMLVQQIQMAVSTGYLNHQILNQPLAPQTLILLNQLLQQIKLLQQLMQQQNAVVQVQGPMSKGTNSTAVLTISVQITKIKQQITNLQNQIAAQQAVYVKAQQQHQQQQQQQQQQQHHMPPQSQNDFFKANMHDPLSALQSNFTDLAINKDSQVSQQQQSRLNQWKLPSLDKDGDLTGNEFSRAPGTTTKSQGNSSPNPLNPLLSQADGTWSSVGRSSGDTGWPDSNSVDVGGNDKDWPVVTSAASQAFTDLVPEFEPGKPWKGNQMKSIEDDPSITPGSVVRSPISLPSIKDSEIFGSGAGTNAGGGGNGGNGGNGTGGGKTSPTTSGSMDMPIPSLSLSSNTWSFQPPSSSTQSFSSPLSKSGGGVGGSAGKSTWGEGPPPSELWSNPKPRQGPPPGLSKAPPTPGTSTASNGWGSIGGRWGSQPNPSWGSPWLLLKNLTPQIDGSTLKTLCLQHGPLQNFHMYLSHNIALAKYNTREEANKAQGALNNCVLGNTTIFADTPPESEVHSMLHNLSQQSSAGAGSWSLRGGSGGPSSAQQSVKNAPPPSSADTWGSGSQLWSGTQATSSLWATTLLEAPDPHRATPSSLNSFLPGDLLGGESM